uniref:Uncharacterized protein n=1 Tax=Cyanistes caeruleus TaxID=156563 RepID=A0A8C0VJG2_CYACU
MLEGKNCNLTQVKIDEVLCLVCYILWEVAASTAPSSRSYLLDICCNVLFYVVLLHGLCSTVYGILLHVLGHVRILDHSLPVRHREPKAEHRFL